MGIVISLMLYQGINSIFDSDSVLRNSHNGAIQVGTTVNDLNNPGERGYRSRCWWPHLPQVPQLSKITQTWRTFFLCVMGKIISPNSCKSRSVGIRLWLITLRVELHTSLDNRLFIIQEFRQLISDYEYPVEADATCHHCRLLQTSPPASRETGRSTSGVTTVFISH